MSPNEDEDVDSPYAEQEFFAQCLARARASLDQPLDELSPGQRALRPSIAMILTDPTVAALIDFDQLRTDWADE